MCRLSQEGPLPEPAVKCYLALHARTLACVASACTDLAKSGDALARLGSEQQPGGSKLNLEALARALLRPPLAHLGGKVMRLASPSQCAGMPYGMCYQHASPPPWTLKGSTTLSPALYGSHSAVRLSTGMWCCCCRE